VTEKARARYSALPEGVIPRLLPTAAAAAYAGFSIYKFHQMVEAGVMPKSLRIGGNVRWDRRKLDAAIDALADNEENQWDKARGDAQAAGRVG
jgi:predicted DNA-binding transcriptional regulator AlpA